MAKKDVLVLIGSGGIGSAIAEKAGRNHHVLCADLNLENAKTTKEKLTHAGISSTAETVDVTSKSSLEDLARKAQSIGSISRFVLATGLSPSRASSQLILKVDLYGVALALEIFRQHMMEGAAGLVVGSQAGHRLSRLDSSVEKELASTPAAELLKVNILNSPLMAEPLYAYQVAKRGSSLRVQYESVLWAKNGARLNTISPGFVSTSLSDAEKSGPNAVHYQKMMEATVCKRPGSPAEIAQLGAYLLGPEAQFVTGSDFLIDGGVTAANRFGEINLEF